MDETSLDKRLLKTNMDDTVSVSESSRSFNNESRNSTKKIRLYVVLFGVSTFLIGSGILLYTLSGNKNTSDISQKLPTGATAPLVKKQTTSPRSTGGQTTISKVTSTNKLTTKESAQDGTAKNKQGCHDNWVSYGDSCYLFSNVSVRWMEAMIRCQNLNAYLVEITTAAENQFLKSHAENIDSLHLRDCFDTTPSKYDGVVNTTYDGYTCQRWDSQTPHEHTRNQPDRFPDASVSEAANYCRDPDNEGSPWCYTTDPQIRWKFCGIYQCPGGNYWTGLTELETKWTWIHSQTDLGQGYSNWGQGQPNLYHTCGSFVGTMDFQWKTQKCLLPAMYICEK